MRQGILLVSVIIAILSAILGASVSMAASSRTVALDETIHFATSDGGDVAIPRGRYEVEQAGSQLLLIEAEGQGRLAVDATPLSHQHEIAMPQALALRIEPDQYQVLLLLAGGDGWMAQGSVGEVRTRGIGRLGTVDAESLATSKGYITGPTDHELLQQVVAKLEALSKQVGPMAQQVNDLQNGKMSFHIQEASRYAYRVCEIVGAHMWGGPAIGCLFGKK